ncbi:hypothetical protein F0562_027156 [Nyssa sinensis]|uniref:Uncharacterized protein n=1 Tax=Nyssa sinensis TaxID=561372 RepID=A0A5J5B4F5_9ASTE|nr:hypothetical protein F0562_027156 [Nyssa sinensis]
MDSGYPHHFVGADSSCISWGHALSGELLYGPNAQKSSAVPKKVDVLEGMHVISVACGFAHSMVVVNRENVGDQLDQLDVYDGKASGEVRSERFSNCATKLSDRHDDGSEEPNAKKAPKKSAVKTSNNSKKRKKSKDSSEWEDEEKVGDEQANGKAEQNRQRGGKASGGGQGKSTGHGRGRPPVQKKSSQTLGVKGSRLRGEDPRSDELQFPCFRLENFVLQVGKVQLLAAMIDPFSVEVGCQRCLLVWSLAYLNRGVHR